MALITAASAVVAAPIVVRSSGPSAKSYPPGKALADNARIALQANDVLMLLDGRGTRTLRGPGTFSANSPASGGTESRSAIATLAAKGSERRARIGAVRSAPVAAKPRSPSIWVVDVAKSSTVCVADPASLQLWRGDAAAPATMTLVAPGGQSQTVSWASGQTSKPWPETIPVSEGVEYRLNRPGQASPTSLRFAMLKPSPAGLEDMASALIKHNCAAQLDLLIETVSVPAATTAS